MLSHRCKQPISVHVSRSPYKYYHRGPNILRIYTPNVVVHPVLLIATHMPEAGHWIWCWSNYCIHIQFCLPPATSPSCVHVKTGTHPESQVSSACELLLGTVLYVVALALAKVYVTRACPSNNVGSM